jgi:hypothetical protein
VQPLFHLRCVETGGTQGARNAGAVATRRAALISERNTQAPPRSRRRRRSLPSLKQPLVDCRSRSAHGTELSPPPASPPGRQGSRWEAFGRVGATPDPEGPAGITPGGLRWGAAYSLKLPSRVRFRARLCENPIDAMIPLLNRRGEVMKGFVQGADRQQTTDGHRRSRLVW